MRPAQSPPEIEQAPIPAPPGYVVWRIKGAKAVTVLPQLLPHAPASVRRAYAARVIGNLVGRCPLCDQVASINVDPERAPAAWAKLDVTIGIEHLTQCEGIMSESWRRFFDPRAVGAER